MYTTSNTILERISLRQDFSGGGRVSPYGESSWPETDVTFDAIGFILSTWIDTSAARKLEMRGEVSDIKGVWEVSEFIQTQVTTAAGRRLRPGDRVKFSTQDAWFYLGEVEDDSGIFGSLPVQKFNLCYSDKQRRS